MNAGGEYVLYRIWATLQDRNGIHAESLLTCVGALAGYACQVYARRARVDVRAPLIESSLSVWSLASRTLQKLEQPLPDVREITGRAPSEGRESRPAAGVYLRQMWPQILPIAQRFCRTPIQLPLLFGIALQRAIEHTKDRLNPTLAARIAMESAVAMARVKLPEPAREPDTPVVVQRKRISRKRDQGSVAPSIGVLVARIPPAARLVTMASVAFMTFAGFMYEGGNGAAADGSHEARPLVSARMSERSVLSADVAPTPESSPFFTAAAAPAPSTAVAEPASGIADATTIEAPPPSAPAATFEEIPDEPAVAYNPPPVSENGMEEGIMRDDYGQPLTE